MLTSNAALPAILVERARHPRPVGERRQSVTVNLLRVRLWAQVSTGDLRLLATETGGRTPGFGFSPFLELPVNGIGAG